MYATVVIIPEEVEYQGAWYGVSHGLAIARLKVVVDLAKDEQVDVERLFWVKLGAEYLHELLGIAIFEDLQLLHQLVYFLLGVIHIKKLLLLL